MKMNFLSAGLIAAGLSAVVLVADTPLAAPSPAETEAARSAVEMKGQTRPAETDDDLKFWLQNMRWYHGFTEGEMRAVTGLEEEALRAALKKCDIGADNRPPRDAKAPLLVLPYPGGRHPRTGFLDGALAPQRETKLSVFPPWDHGGWVVLDVPEALWSNLGLTYLAHTHVDTIWSKQNIKLPQLEWTRQPNGRLESRRELPNGIVFGVEARPGPSNLALRMWLRNGTTAPLTGLKVQMCAMLKETKGFEAQTNDNKRFEPPFAACRNADGTRWIIHGWTPIERAWGNPPCPCLHADPKIPDCPPGETREVAGWLSFYEGTDLRGELKRIAAQWPGEREGGTKVQ